MKLSCKQCGREIAAKNINMERLIAKCDACNAVFGFADDVPGASAPAKARPKRAKVPLPPGFQVEDTGVGFRIIHRWWRPMFIFLAFFTVFWCGFLLFWYAIAASAEAPIFFFLFPLIHVAVGVGLAYFTLAGFINRTVIDVTGQELAVNHIPLPWFGARSHPVDELKQLYVVERTNSGKHGVRYSYDLCAVSRYGDQLKVLSGLQAVDQALYLEQTIEERLGIEDEAVPGEVRK